MIKRFLEKCFPDKRNTLRAEEIQENLKANKSTS